MISDWIIAIGVVTVFSVVGVLIFLCRPTGNDLLSPLAAYHRALNDAQAARGQFLRSGFVAATMSPERSHLLPTTKMAYSALSALLCR